MWYKEQWEQGMVLENDKVKFDWDFEFNQRKTETARRPDLILKWNIWIFDIACPMQQNIDIKWRGKVTQYQQPVFETRERRPRYPVMIVPVTIGAQVGMKKQWMIWLYYLRSKNY